MLTRRLFLRGASTLACSAAAHPLISTVTFAAAPGDARLVVIVLRGAMDGLDVLRPVGDPAYAGLRPKLLAGPRGERLDSFYELHPSLAPILPLWRAGELGFAQAVSTPYRDKRSHFDGQDILEAGTGNDLPPAAERDGWLNRLVQVMPGARAETAFSVGVEEMLILSGKAPYLSWAPETRLSVTPQAQLLLDHVVHDDPLFREATAEALLLAGADPDGMAGGTGALGPSQALGKFAAEKLVGETRIASFSLTGWDTHRGQEQAISRALDRLAATILALRDGLGTVWGRTTVLAMTEFGRTARENGSGGTDHGTGGTMIMAGGAVRGGRVFGDWPGLADGDLYEGRDLMPTADVRAYAGWAMRGLYGLEAGTVEKTVFPGLDLGRDPGLLL